MKPYDKLNEVFDIQPLEGEVITKNNEVILPETNAQSEKIDFDYNKSRLNLHSLLQSGAEALEHALEVAKSSEHPRAFEVVGNLMKQLADVNQQLLELHTKKQKLDNPGKAKEEEQGVTKTVTNNNAIFVGSTADLNKLINDMHKE